MNRCLINQQSCNETYSAAGLKSIDKKLHNIAVLQYSQKEQLFIAAANSDKMSISGVQPKMAASLNVGKGSFKVVDFGGTYIIKPQNIRFPSLPENEALTMLLARQAGIDVPACGLLRCSDGSLSYFIKRFDRLSAGKKLSVEDFTQLSQANRQMKYQSSMEKLVTIIDDNCHFPYPEKVKFFRRVIFNFICGNEDMHLKNYSLIALPKKGIRLAPAYDFLNSTMTYMSLDRPLQKIEESALPLKGKKRKLKRSLWLDYYAIEKLQLLADDAAKIIDDLKIFFASSEQMIDSSFLNEQEKMLYKEIIQLRLQVL